MSFVVSAESHDGATPIREDEAADLIPPNISTQGQLNEWEQMNIASAAKWLVGQKFTVERILSADFVRRLHHRMFNRTWKWAGSYRKSDKSIGGPWYSIPAQLKNLFENTQAQLDGGAAPIDEIAARFHHALVVIHPFPNGNGRHSRLVTDTLLATLGHERFTWGRKPLTEAGVPRDTYIRALKSADRGEFNELLAFVRS